MLFTEIDINSQFCQDFASKLFPIFAKKKLQAQILNTEKHFHLKNLIVKC